MPNAPYRTVAILLLAAAFPLAGCGSGDVDRPAPPDEPAGPTYHQDVAPILRDHCEACHREGGLAPFALGTYEEVKTVAGLVATQTRAKKMPPFGAEDTAECQPVHGWKNDPRLDEAEIALLEAWSAAGAPEGPGSDADDPPPAATFELPGTEIEMSPLAPFVATGEADVFRCFVLDPKLAADTFLNGVQVLPGNPAVVHHAVIFSDPTGASSALADASGGYECFGGANVAESTILDVWVPGSPPREYGADIGTPLTAGSKIVMQIHYHPIGTTADPDLTRVQMRFVDSPVYQLVTLGFGNFDAPMVDAKYGVGELLPGPNDQGGVEFRVPANVADHSESMRLTIGPGDDAGTPDIFIYGVFNHMHYVGTDMRFGMKHAAQGGAEECLLHTPHWDFAWQRFYTYDGPVDQLSKVGPGDVFDLACKYDNTMSNPYVQRALAEQGLKAPVEVHLGEQTLDEMCVGALQVVVPIAP